MVTIKEVASRAKVSVGTVSNVISGLVPVGPRLRDRVEKAIAELNYHPNYVARGLRTKQTHMLGIVISDITNPFFPLLVRGAEDAASKHGYLLTTFNTDDLPERERQVMGVLRSRRADGILLVVAPSTGTDHIQGAIDAGIAVVCLDRVPKGIQVDAVTVNNLKGAEMCVRHLIQSGHTRIGIITGPLVLQTARDRFRGYENVLRENGLTLDRGLVREGNFRVDSGYRLGKDLCLSGARPSALFVTNGMMGAGVVKALRELGVEYPRDMSLAVFDGLPWSDIFRPDVTSVVQPSYEMGFRGAELLIRRLQGKLPGRKVKAQLELELKVGDSAASRVSERSAQP